MKSPLPPEKSFGIRHSHRINDETTFPQPSKAAGLGAQYFGVEKKISNLFAVPPWFFPPGRLFASNAFKRGVNHFFALKNCVSLVSLPPEQKKVKSVPFEGL